MGYAEDIKEMVVAEVAEELVFRFNEAVEAINKWIVRNEEFLTLKKPKNRVRLDFELKDEKLVPVKKLKYLGIILDERLCFIQHVRYGKTTQK